MKFKFLVLSMAVGLLTACSDADVASRNLSKAADNFDIARRVVFYSYKQESCNYSRYSH